MTIQAVFFDMGGTIETFGYTRELRLKTTADIQRRLLEAGLDLKVDTEELYEIISSGLKKYKAWSIATLEELPSQRVWRDFILAGHPFDPVRLSEVAEDLMLMIETDYYERRMRPGMAAVLEAIRQMGLKIGIISNVNSRGQVPFNLAKYGIRHYFDPIVLSSEYGWRKPDPAIFHYAARLARVPTSACAYVGDRIARDVLGARRAGFKLAVQIRHDYDHGEDDSGAVPDHVITDMTELLPILRAEGARTPPAAAPEGIHALLFDAGDILYHRPDKGSGFKAFIDEMGLPDCDQSPEKDLLTQQAYRGEIDQDQYREAVLRLYGVRSPGDIERGKRALEADDNNVEFMEGVADTLLALKERGFLLGIVTDSANSVHTKLKWLEAAGIGHVWDSFTSSLEVGTRKPDPRIYRAALEQLGAAPGRTVFVGHKASELEGARGVGMHTVAFNRDPDAEADITIEKFEELLRLPILA